MEFANDNILDFKKEKEENILAKKRAVAIAHMVDGCPTADDKMILRTWRAEKDKFRKDYPQDISTISAVLGIESTVEISEEAKRRAGVFMRCLDGTATEIEKKYMGKMAEENYHRYLATRDD